MSRIDINIPHGWADEGPRRPGAGAAASWNDLMLYVAAFVLLAPLAIRLCAAVAACLLDD